MKAFFKKLFSFFFPPIWEYGMCHDTPARKHKKTCFIEIQKDGGGWYRVWNDYWYEEFIPSNPDKVTPINQE